MAGPNDHLIPYYVDYLRARSALATTRDYGPLELAAHMFAVAQQLVEDGHRLGKPSWGVGDLAQLGLDLAHLSAEITAQSLYDVSTNGLALVEGVLCKNNDESYCREIDIGELKVAGERRLGGHVVCWTRSRRVFRALREQKLADAGEAAKSLYSQLENPGKHLDRLFCLWNRGNEAPRVVRAEPAEARAPLVLEPWHQLGLGAHFRIALCPLAGKAHPAFDLTEDRGGFRACVHQPMIEPAGHAVREQLAVILEIAAREGIHLLVFPELMVDVATRDWLIQTLRSRRARSGLPLGVIAGSFHVDKATSDRPYNESRFVDGRGWELLEHQKRGRFRVTRRQVKGLLDRGFFCGSDQLRSRLSQLPHEIEEHIEPGARVELLEAGVGQMAVLICADAIDDVNRRQLRDVAARLRPDFLFLPAMSPKTALFDEFMAGMERQGVSTFFVNAHCVCPRGQTLAAVCLSLFRVEGGSPTRVRWRRGVPLEEWTPHLGVWRILADPGLPFSWLRGPREKRLGLVVDLGAYWR